MTFAKTFASAIMLLLVGCASAPVPRAPGSLTGTAWQLHAIQSMDDAQGTTRIADPSRFTLQFGTNDRLSLQLDCNRGTGTWQAQVQSQDSGALSFGPIATTKVLCPPPNTGERVARDLAYVRSYRFIDGKLFMSLMADGGIYEWHRQRD